MNSTRAPPKPARTDAERQSTGKDYGYPIGIARDRDSCAYGVAEAMNVPDHEMSVESWALYHAARFANQAMNWHLAVKTNPDDPRRVMPEQILAVSANRERA